MDQIIATAIIFSHMSGRRTFSGAAACACLIGLALWRDTSLPAWTGLVCAMIFLADTVRGPLAFFSGAWTVALAVATGGRVVPVHAGVSLGLSVLLLAWMLALFTPTPLMRYVSPACLVGIALLPVAPVQSPAPSLLLTAGVVLASSPTVWDVCACVCVLYVASQYVLPADTVIASFPRSGNHLVRYLVEHSTHKPTADLLAKWPRFPMARLEYGPGNEPLKHVRKDEPWIAFKSHGCFNRRSLGIKRMVLVVRDARRSALSFVEMALKLMGMPTPTIRESVSAPWFSHLLMCAARDMALMVEAFDEFPPESRLLLTLETMLDDIGSLTRLCEFFNVPADSVEDSHALAAECRKGRAPFDLAEDFWLQHGTTTLQVNQVADRVWEEFTGQMRASNAVCKHVPQWAQQN